MSTQVAVYGPEVILPQTSEATSSLYLQHFTCAMKGFNVCHRALSAFIRNTRVCVSYCRLPVARTTANLFVGDINSDTSECTVTLPTCQCMAIEFHRSGDNQIFLQESTGGLVGDFTRCSDKSWFCFASESLPKQSFCNMIKSFACLPAHRRVGVTECYTRLHHGETRTLTPRSFCSCNVKIHPIND